MANEKNSNLKKRMPILRRALIATIKGALLFVAYVVLSQFLAPISQFVPGFQQSVETFVTVYIIFIIIAELTSGSILQHFFNAAKDLFLIGYLIVSLGTGALSLSFQGLNFVVDIRLFLVIGMLLGLVGLAKSILQTINYLNERAELAFAIPQ
jgi:hypothetical protein